MNSIKAYENFFICQQLLVTAVVVAGFIFGVVYLIHRIGLENREVDEANKEKEKGKEEQVVKEPIKNDENLVAINKKKATYKNEILARFEKTVEKDNAVSKETSSNKVVDEKEGRQMVEEAVETASVFGDTTVSVDAPENSKKPANVVSKPQPKTKTDKTSSKVEKPQNVVKKSKPIEKPKVDIMGEL